VQGNKLHNLVHGLISENFRRVKGVVEGNQKKSQASIVKSIEERNLRESAKKTRGMLKKLFGLKRGAR